MGYFDDRADQSFMTSQDGSRLFFPWGSLGSGYVIASQEDYERLRGHLKDYIFVCLITVVVLGSPVSFSTSPIVWIAFAVIASLLCYVPYLVWMWRLLPRMKVSDERMPRQSFSAALKAAQPIGPWTVPDPSVPPAKKVSD